MGFLKERDSIVLLRQYCLAGATWIRLSPNVYHSVPQLLYVSHTASYFSSCEDKKGPYNILVFWLCTLKPAVLASQKFYFPFCERFCSATILAIFLQRRIIYLYQPSVHLTLILSQLIRRQHFPLKPPYQRMILNVPIDRKAVISLLQ